MMEKQWTLQILGGPIDGETRTLEAGSKYWREPDVRRQLQWAAGPELQESEVISFTVYLVVSKRDGRRYLAHPSLHLT